MLMNTEVDSELLRPVRERIMKSGHWFWSQLDVCELEALDPILAEAPGLYEAARKIKAHFNPNYYPEFEGMSRLDYKVLFYDYPFPCEGNVCWYGGWRMNWIPSDKWNALSGYGSADIFWLAHGRMHSFNLGGRFVDEPV